MEGMMSGFKQLLAGMLCLLWITSAQAFHYSIYKPVVSTAFEPVEKEGVEEGHPGFMSLVDKAQMPSLLLMKGQASKSFQITLHNTHLMPVEAIQMHVPRGLPISLQSEDCSQHYLLPTTSCQFKWVYKVTKTNEQRRIIPLTLQYKYKGHTINEHLKMLAVLMPSKTFYKAPIQEYPTAEGIGSDYIKTLYIDHNGELFIGSDGGLSEGVVHNHYFKNLTSLNGLVENDITAILKDPSGTLYVGTDGGGLAISNDGGLTFTSKTTQDGLAGNYIRALYWKDHRLYIGTNHGLSISNNQAKSFVNHDNTHINGVMINQIKADHRGHLFIATDDGLAESDNEGDSFYQLTTNNGLGDNAVNGIAIDKNNCIYAATEHGLSVSDNDGNSFNNYTKQNGLLSNRILSIAVSPADQTVYVGTDHGLNIKNKQAMTFVAQSDNRSIDFDPVNAIEVSPDRSIVYLALGGDGLGILNNIDNQMSHIKTNLVADNLLSGLWVQNHQVDIATASGLSESLDGGKTFYTWKPKQGDASVNAFYEGVDGSEYIGTTHGLYVRKQHGDKVLLLPNYQINSIVQMNNEGQLLVGTDRGILISQDHGKHFVQHTMDDGLGSDRVHQVAYDPMNHMIYVATQHGLSISSDGEHRFSNHRLNGHSDNNILSIALSPLGTVFVATQQGLYKGIWSGGEIQLEKLEINGHANQAIASVHTNAKNGLLFVGCQGAVYISKDGGESFVAYTHGLAGKTIIGADVLADNKTLLVATRQHGLWAGIVQ
jgi:ligand-binding sensor domain-containing protein